MATREVYTEAKSGKKVTSTLHWSGFCVTCAALCVDYINLFELNSEPVECQLTLLGTMLVIWKLLNAAFVLKSI